MTCLAPIKAYGCVNKEGFIDTQLSFKEGDGDIVVYVPCRHCIGCQLQRRALMSLLFKMEYSAYELENIPMSFITLTYNDRNLPPSGLVRNDISQFIKSLKNYLRKIGYPYDVEYVYSGEYGLKNMRPHYHVCLLGVDVFDVDPSVSIHRIGTYQSSALVDKIWHKGFNVTCPCNLDTGCYTLGYTCKKIVIAGDTYDDIKYATILRQKKAGFKGKISSPISKRALKGALVAQKIFFDNDDLMGCDDFCKAYNKMLTQKMPEYIDFCGRKIENPLFPKGQCFLHKKKFFRKEFIQASCSLGKKFFDNYQNEFLTGFVHDPFDGKLLSIPTKFLKMLENIDFSAYARIKRNKAFFTSDRDQKVERYIGFYDDYKNSVISRFKGGSVRTLDLAPLTPEQEEQYDNLSV